MLPAGQPHGQVVLVIRRDPRGTQYGPDIQTEGEENAHQSDQLQRRQHGHPDLLCAAHRRSHARSKLCQTITLKIIRRVSLRRQNCCSQVDVPPAISCQDGELRVSPRPECGGCSRWNLRSAAGTGPRISEVTNTCPCWVLVPDINI